MDYKAVQGKVMRIHSMFVLRLPRDEGSPGAEAEQAIIVDAEQTAPFLPKFSAGTRGESLCGILKPL